MTLLAFRRVRDSSPRRSRSAQWDNHAVPIRSSELRHRGQALSGAKLILRNVARIIEKTGRRTLSHSAAPGHWRSGERATTSRRLFHHPAAAELTRAVAQPPTPSRRSPATIWAFCSAVHTAPTRSRRAFEPARFGWMIQANRWRMASSTAGRLMAVTAQQLILSQCLQAG
jgi:hypothetical protein